MKCILVALLACLAALPMSGRADAPSDSLQMTTAERGFFQLGRELGQASFGYAGLAHQAGQIARTANPASKVTQLAALTPVALQSRSVARDGFQQALAQMQALDAPTSTMQPVQAAVARLAKPVALTGDARPIAWFSRNAAQTLATLNEYDALSSIPESPTLQHWLASPAAGTSAHVWFTEGLISALAIVAAKWQMSILLPPVKEIATDLRGLRDWLTLRLPDTPTDDQAALENAIDTFLNTASRAGLPAAARLSAAQLAALGDISRRLQAQVSDTFPNAYAATF